MCFSSFLVISRGRNAREPSVGLFLIEAGTSRRVMLHEGTANVVALACRVKSIICQTEEGQVASHEASRRALINELRR